MSNIHGLNDYSNRQTNQRRHQLQQSQNQLSMLGISEQDLQLMGT